MPMAKRGGPAEEPSQITTRDFDLTVVDHLGHTHTLAPRGCVLVMDPTLAVAAEVAGLDYVYVNPAHVAIMAVMAVPAEPPLLLPAHDVTPTSPPTELLEEQLNGVAETAPDRSN